MQQTFVDNNFEFTKKNVSYLDRCLIFVVLSLRADPLTNSLKLRHGRQPQMIVGIGDQW